MANLSTTEYGKLDVQSAQFLSNDYFNYYSNGGLGRLPNPVFEDQITTDQYVARRMNYPTMGAYEYFNDTTHSPHYQWQENRVKTTAKQLSSLKTKGIPLVGNDGDGRYRKIACTPDYSGNIKEYNQSMAEGTHTMLWLLIGIGTLVFVTSALTPY